MKQTTTTKSLALGVAMVCLSLIVAAATGSLVSWFGVAFFGLAFATLVLNRLRPTTLAIHPESMEIIGPLGGRRSFHYSQCGPFGVYKQTVARGRHIDWLTFDYDGRAPRTWLQRGNSKMAGTNTQLRVDGYGPSPAEIAELLNTYRTGARTRSDGR